jgi:hypothetical protein
MAQGVVLPQPVEGQDQKRAGQGRNDVAQGNSDLVEVWKQAEQPEEETAGERARQSKGEVNAQAETALFPLDDHAGEGPAKKTNEWPETTDLRFYQSKERGNSVVHLISEIAIEEFVNCTDATWLKCFRKNASNEAVSRVMTRNR